MRWLRRRVKRELRTWELIKRWWLKTPSVTTVTWPLETWQVEPCWRCGVHHPGYCDLCSNHPPCADHVCSWTEEEEDEGYDGDETVEVPIRWP